MSNGETTHELKVWPEFFEPLVTQQKTFEVRKDDRPMPYRTGDTLVLREWRPIDQIYTGRVLVKRVTYLLCGPGFGIERGFVCMALGHSDESANRPDTERRRCADWTESWCITFEVRGPNRP
jgi:Domain of unknown function (DUF3850)